MWGTYNINRVRLLVEKNLRLWLLPQFLLDHSVVKISRMKYFLLWKAHYILPTFENSSIDAKAPIFVRFVGFFFCIGDRCDASVSSLDAVVGAI